MILAVSDFYAEIKSEDSLAHFFENISVRALEVHQLKLFKTLYGPAEEKPNQDEYFEFILATHTRLFREQGLTAEHFDTVAACLVRAFQGQLYAQDLIDEAVTELAPLRVVFDYGAQVAAREKSYTVQQIRSLPTASAATIGTDQAALLPDPAWVEEPGWLSESLEQHSSTSVVRAWTKMLTDRFIGDSTIADTFMDMPYMNHHVYGASLLQLALLPSGQDPSVLLDILKYPRGPNHSAMAAVLWLRMVTQFALTAAAMQMDGEVAERSVHRLLSYESEFKPGVAKLTGGMTSHHVLRRAPPSAAPRTPLARTASNLSSPHDGAKPSKSGRQVDDASSVLSSEYGVSVVKKYRQKLKSRIANPDTTTSSSGGSDYVMEQTPAASRSYKTKKPKGTWRKLLGWVKA